MKKIFFILILLPSIIWGQEEKRTSLFFSITQGVSYLNKEALSNSRDKTFPVTFGYAYSLGAGLSIKSTKGKSFSDIKMSYRSYGNGFLSAQDATGTSSKRSTDRFNYLSIGYQYARYVKTLKNFNTFFSLGVEFSYILNRKMKLNYDNRTLKIKTKGKDISTNYGITTPSTFSLGYGIELDKGVLNVGKQSRLSFNLALDQALFQSSSPSHQYFGAYLCYQMLF